MAILNYVVCMYVSLIDFIHLTNIRFVLTLESCR